MNGLEGYFGNKFCCYKIACNYLNLQAENIAFSPLCKKIITK